jgi:hypothetical protein
MRNRPLDLDPIRLNRIKVGVLRLSMILSENRKATFRDHALINEND